MSNRDFVLGVAVVGLVVGSMVLGGVTDHCKGPATCSAPSGVSGLKFTAHGDGPLQSATQVDLP
jgi:hypothetical protein